MSEPMTNDQIHDQIEAAFKTYSHKTTMCRTPECKFEAEHLRKDIQQMIAAELERREK
jgi:hypothetical protein